MREYWLVRVGIAPTDGAGGGYAAVKCDPFLWALHLSYGGGCGEKRLFLGGIAPDDRDWWRVRGGEIGHFLWLFLRCG